MRQSALDWSSAGVFALETVGRQILRKAGAPSRRSADHTVAMFQGERHELLVRTSMRRDVRIRLLVQMAWTGRA